MVKEEIINWLLQGDVSIQYQTHRDLLGHERPDLRARIAFEGWGAKFLSKRFPDGHWGQRFYQPKWTSTHYTLLDLRNLYISPETEQIRQSVKMVIQTEKSIDGGIGPFGEQKLSDLCVNGMFLNYASYFKSDAEDLKSVVDCILNQIMPDGGFNCRSNRSKTRHSSLHTTLSILEGLIEYVYNGYDYRKGDVKSAVKSAQGFILLHEFFLSDRTGEVINEDFLKLSYPRRWRYDILSALDHFQYADAPWDERMHPAIDVVRKKRNKDGTWNVQAKHPGRLHFEMEKAGKPSRWNTLRAIRVLKHYQGILMT